MCYSIENNYIDECYNRSYMLCLLFTGARELITDSSKIYDV